MVNLRFDWVVTSAKMHLNLIVRFFFFQLARFTSYSNAPFLYNYYFDAKRHSQHPQDAVSAFLTSLTAFHLHFTRFYVVGWLKRPCFMWLKVGQNQRKTPSYQGFPDFVPLYRVSQFAARFQLPSYRKLLFVNC